MISPLFILLIVALALALALAAGAVFQTFAERDDLRRHPAPGQFVNVGGRALHFFCRGEANGPTVVIEAGGGNDSTLWGGIVAQVSRYAHVCTYDRAGLGWSDPAPSPRTFQSMASDLHALLTRAGMTPPFILVGHSYGGYIVRWFVERYPGSVAGIVLVDATEEGYTFDLWGLKYAADVRNRERLLGWLCRFGLLRVAILLMPKRFDPVREVPPGALAEMRALYLRSARHFAAAAELAAYEAVPDSMRRPGGFGSLGKLPLIVVSRGAKDPHTGKPISAEWQAAQDRLAVLSGDVRRIIAAKSGHMIQFDEPDVLVDAIKQLWDRVRH